MIQQKYRGIQNVRHSGIGRGEFDKKVIKSAVEGEVAIKK